MSTGEQVTVGALLIAEYDQVKEEQRARISFRDNLLYASLASMAAVITAVLHLDGGTRLLLLLPPISVLLGWTYVVNDEKVSALGRYVRDELAPQLAVLAGGLEKQRVFGWERAHRSDSRRSSRKWLQLAVDLLTFCFSPLAALVVFWACGVDSVSLFVVSLGELAAIAVLCWQIVIYADTKRS